MAFGYLVVAIVAAAVAVFALQNGAPTPVRLIAWTVEDLPLAALILASLAGGLIIAGVPLMIQRWRLRSRLRAAELEAAAATRAEGIRAPAPGPPEPRPRSSAPPVPRAMP
jgi:uncharacterized integral membrane protein